MIRRLGVRPRAALRLPLLPLLLLGSACFDGVDEASATSTGSGSGSSSGDPATGSTPPTADSAAEASGDAGSGDGSALPSYCGDGMIDAGEECDDGNLIDHDGCTNACTAAACGDGVLQDGETCDDGNDDVTDDCPACRPATCGDGFVHARDEICDDGNADPNDDCVACSPAACGDGMLHAGVEDCDGMALGGQTCVSLGHLGGRLGCTPMCEFDESMCTEEPMMPA